VAQRRFGAGFGEADDGEHTPRASAAAGQRIQLQIDDNPCPVGLAERDLFAGRARTRRAFADAP
jgi:hypothetical protein